jgi:hypothetical protein
VDGDARDAHAYLEAALHRAPQEVEGEEEIFERLI